MCMNFWVVFIIAVYMAKTGYKNIVAVFKLQFFLSGHIKRTVGIRTVECI